MNKLRFLPPDIDLETKTILKKLSTAHRYLAELKGISGILPNQEILINTLFLQEAKDSSYIENIVTTQDDLFIESLFPEVVINASAKEVYNYDKALKAGYDLIKQKNLLTNNTIIQIHAFLDKNTGFRTMPGTHIKNSSGEIIYTPPQDGNEIVDYMTNLEHFINDDEFYLADPLIKMAILHYQFESIHPFYDGNGRTGRIINVLYLTLKGLMPIPVLYLSRYIVRTKSQYYQLLQKIRKEEAWEEWILYMLEGIESTSKHTITMMQDIHHTFQHYQTTIKDKFKFYSQDLVNLLFMHTYTKIDFLMSQLNISRITATNYLEALTQDNLLKKEKIGKHNYYINTALLKVLTKSEES